MSNKLNIIFLLFICSVFSQKTSKIITFDVKENIYLNEISSSKDKKISIASTDILIKDTNFSILLLDYNKNNYFLDTLNSNTKKGLDGILIADYRKYQNIKRGRNERHYFKNNFPFSINGVQYELSNFKKINDKTYQANLQYLENDESYQIIENKNGVYIDRLLNLKINNFTNTKTLNLKEIPIGKELIYFNLFNYPLLELTYGFKELKILKIRYPKLKVINICVFDDKNYIKAIIKKFHVKIDDLYYINADNYSDLLKIGYNNNVYSNNILFNNSGEVIRSLLSHKDLKEYLNKRYPNRPVIKIKKQDSIKSKKISITYKHAGQTHTFIFKK